MDEEDIDVSLSHDSLTIRGEKQQETEEDGNYYCRSERRWVEDL
jgi:HSP20 family molecular chaperone IbpA